MQTKLKLDKNQPDKIITKQIKAKVYHKHKKVDFLISKKDKSTGKRERNKRQRFVVRGE